MTQTIGFTGTRDAFALTGVQIGWLWDTLQHFASESAFTNFRHGDCIGADEIAHGIAKTLGYTIAIHPPTDDRYRAFCQTEPHLMFAPRPYLDRNKDIVNASDVMLALPGGPEKQRSGTWSTIRYTEGVGKAAHGILPNSSTFTRYLGQYSE